MRALYIRVEDRHRLARARAAKQRFDRRKRNLKLRHHDVAALDRHFVQIVRLQKAVGAGDHDDGIVGLREHDKADAGVALARLHVAQIDAVAAQELAQLRAERISSGSADEKRLRPALRRRERLIGALAAGIETERFAENCFAGLRKAIRSRHHVHDEASRHEDPAHAIAQRCCEARIASPSSPVVTQGCPGKIHCDAGTCPANIA